MAKPLTYAMGLLKNGALNIEAGEMLATMIRAVEETGKPGRLTLTIDVARQGAALSVLGRVTDKTPEEKPLPDLFWSTVEGHLTLQNPNQRSLDLQVVPEKRPEAVQSIDPSTREIMSAAG